MRSPIPARARKNSPRGRLLTRPNSAMAPPHTMPAPITTRPGRRSRPVQPLVAAPTSAPRPGAATSKPNVADPPWKWVAARAGNNADGMPNNIALVSTSSIPATTPLWRTYRTPSASDFSPGRCVEPDGGSGRSPISASAYSARQAASMA